MTTEIKDSAFRAYEEYILKGKKVDEGLKSLVEGSDTFNYLKCIDILTKRGPSLTSEERSFLESYIFRASTQESRKIAVRYDLLQYDSAKSEEDKKRILDKLASNYLNLRFEHPQPSDLGAKPASKAVEGPKEEKPVLDAIDVVEELKHLYSRSRGLSEYNKSALARVDLTKLTSNDFIQLLRMMGQDIILLDSPALYEVYAKWLAEEYKKNKYYGVNPEILRNMTIEQMERLRNKLPGLNEDETFSGIYVSKKFSRELSEEENSHLTYKERRANLIKMYEYAKILPHKLSGLKSSLLLEILENGLKLDLYEESYFLEYLSVPARDNFVKRGVAPNVGTWRNCIQSVQAAHNRQGVSSQLRDKDRELLTKYLQYFFLHGKTVENFNEFVEQRLLVAVWEVAMLTSGKKVEFTPENTGRLEKVAGEVSINIGDQNKDVFAIGEDVSLWIELKNVPTLFIKVFEINTENYYRKNMSPFKTDVNLDGLIASIERTVEYKQAPQILFREELKFPELKNKMGLFVIELIGNGRSSRAILKIGTLSVITRPTVAGQVCYILDGERKVCSHESTGIWMDSQYFKASVERGGRIMVPYLPSGGSRTSKAILLHQGLAQLVEIGRMEEVYTLHCGFYVLPESFIMGKIATIMLRPQLQVNGRLADLSLLKNIKCTLYTSNYIDNIPSTKVYDKLTLSETGELLIKFQVGANIDKMGLVFAAEVQNISKDRRDTLTAQHEISFATHTSDNATAELYLRLTPSHQYELLVLGKNGEPIANSLVNLNFTSEMFGYVITREGTTNAEGVVRLGRLKGVLSLSAVFTQSSGKTRINKTWMMPDSTVMQYPAIMDIVEDETVDLPVAAECFDEKRFTLRSVEGGMVLSDCSSALAREAAKDQLYGTVHVKGLKSGKYVLSGVGKSDIAIHVHRGVYWPENPAYILKQYSLLENSAKQGFIKIKNVNFEETKEGKGRMSIQIEGATKNQWRVHVMLFRYIPENLNQLTMTLLARDSFTSVESFFQKWTNFYLSNRELSTEFRYCFDRRHQTRFTGNTLDKPKLVLKRTLIQSTRTEQEAQFLGTTYSAVAEAPMQVPQSKADYDLFQQQVVPEACMLNCMPEGDRLYSRSMAFEPPSRGPRGEISMFQNFLGLEPLAKYNMPASPDGKIVVELEENYGEKYGCALILAVDRGSVAHYLHPLAGTKVQKRDLSLAKPLSCDKTYSEMRTNKCVEKYETYLIDDITNTDLQTVDSLEKVLLIIKELMRMYGVSIQDFDKFERLIQWNGLAEEEKNKVMSRYTSHELHLFIYKKDPDYFNRVVKGYLQNKMEKTFVDFYLLKDLASMLPYATNPSLHELLNPLEKALLAESLVSSGNTKLATEIALRMRHALLAQKKTAAEQNRVFDTVLSLGALKTNKDSMSLWPYLDVAVGKLKEEATVSATSAQNGMLDMVGGNVDPFMPRNNLTINTYT